LQTSLGPIAMRRRLSPASNIGLASPHWSNAGRTLVLLCADLLAFAVASLLVLCLQAEVPSLAAGLGAGGGRVFPSDTAISCGCIMIYLATRGRYTSRIPFWTDMHSLASATFFAAGAGIALAALTGDLERRLTTIVVILLATVLAVIFNRLAKVVLSSVGTWPLPAVIIGDAARGEHVLSTLLADKSLGYQVVARVDPSALTPAAGFLNLSHLLIRHHAKCLLIAAEDTRDQRTLVEAALRERVPFATIVQPGFCCQVTRLLGQDAMLLSHASGLSQPLARLLKVTFDIVAAAAVLLLAVPVLAVIALFVRSDGGPVLFAHRRLGLDGRHFNCLKFRTMATNAEQVLEQVLAADPERAAEWRATQKLRDDPRITWIGQFLRSTSLDELPQLLNVLRLEMSLVGPRPIVDNEVTFYGDDFAHYCAIRPGITGLWQVSGRSDTSYVRRVQLDVWYVNNWTIWCDIAVLLKTIPAVIRRRGAR
jgi:Undecaprenyl-phosphate galactose phosphotransferase WbaP